MTTLIQDLRFTLRQLRRAPGFAAAAVLTLALGIGATTAVFTVVDGMLFKPLPYPEADRLVKPSVGFMRAEYDILWEESRTLEELALYRDGVGFTISGTGEADHLQGAVVTPNLFPLLGGRPALGRTLGPGVGADEVVLSHALWQQRFGGDPGVVGERLLVDGVPRTIVGVMPADFYFPAPGTRLWVPLVVDPGSLGTYWGEWGGHAIGRLAPGVTPQAATAELRGFGEPLRLANPFWTPDETYLQESTIVPLREAVVGDMRRILLVLLGAVGFVLLIACANLGNLLLARGLARRKEIAVRSALGAARRRIARQLLTESVVLAVAGGLAGTVLALWGVQAFLGLLPAELPLAPEVAVDLRVLAFAFGLTVATGTIAGLLPAWRLTRGDLRGSLATASGSTSSTPKLSSALVVGEIALALVLVAGAALLVQSLRQMLDVELGFRTEQLTAAQLNPPRAVYDHPDRLRELYGTVLERVRAVPGVTGVALASQLPLDGTWDGAAVFVRGVHTDPRAPLPVFERRRVTPDFFRALDLPLLAGRPLTEADRAGAPLTVVIDETAAREFWPDGDPLGQEIGFPWADRWMTVVGVVGAARSGDPGAEAEPTMYVPFEQEPVLAMTVVVRGTASPDLLGPALRSVVTEIDPGVPVGELRPLDHLVAASVATPRAIAVLLGSFALLSLLLAAIGIYGIMSYSVRQRTREIGVRMAFGARRTNVQALVVRQGAVLVALGLAAGVVVAAALTQVLRGMLFEVSPTDPATFAVVSLILAAVALLAAWLPARRAARVDPMIALRAE